MAYITVDQIVRNILADTGQNTTHDYLRLLHIANRGLKELTFDVLGDTRATLLEVSSALRVDLPSDYVDYEFVGIVQGDGRVKPLGFRRNIPLVGDGNTKMAQIPSYYDDDGYVGYGGVYGYGGGQNRNGYYQPVIDKDNWQMILSSIAAGSYIYLEYTSDGRQEGGQNIIHPYAEEALTAYVYWKSIQRVKGAHQYDKESARRDYYNEKRLARARIKAFTKEEALQAIRTGFKQSPKI